MKILFIIIFTFIAVIIAALFIFQMNSKVIDSPSLVEGKLSKCSDKPNCVNSEYEEDSNHFIDPIILQNTNIDYSAVLKKVIQEMGGEIQTQQSDYITATFTSSILRFVDDLEIRVDASELKIHLRSASRVGHSDFGVNRTRIETFKTLFNDKVK